jgi:hypothetical protein
MLKFFRIPLLFLGVGSIIGVFLRWQFISATPGINYAFFLHAHSHIMFLGWIFNVLYIAFVSGHIEEKEQRFFRILFVLLQILVLGMMISFPLEGYAFYSILFSILHTLAAVVFIVRFYSRTKHSITTSAWYARVAIVFFIISTAGPFSLGYLMAQGLGHTTWYYFAIYFYLHFQYNGFFLFGIFSLFFGLLERKMVRFSPAKTKAIGIVLATTCLPAYLLSVLWVKPELIIHVAGGLTAIVQLWTLVMLIALIRKNINAIRQTFSPPSLMFLSIVLPGFAAKLVLQLASAFPAIAQMAYELQPVVIAYLHLVLLAVISLFLFVWYLESGLIAMAPGKRIVALFLVALAGMEACLVLTPWWSKVSGVMVFPVSNYLFFFSAMLSLSCLLLYITSLKKLTKISVQVDEPHKALPA